MPTPKVGEFSTGLFECCSQPGGFPRCLYGTFCTCCLYGNNSALLSSGEAPCGGNCGGACCLFCVLGTVGPVLSVPVSLSCIIHMSTRAAIRRKYDIKGDGCFDCLITTFCVPCALCQEARELDIRGTMQGSPGAPYMMPGPMYAGPPVSGQPAVPHQPGQEMHAYPPPAYPPMQPPAANYPPQPYSQQPYPQGQPQPYPPVPSYPPQPTAPSGYPPPAPYGKTQ